MHTAGTPATVSSAYWTNVEHGDVACRTDKHKSSYLIRRKIRGRKSTRTHENVRAKCIIPVATTSIKYVR